MTLRAVSSIGTSGGGIGLKSAGVLAQTAVATSVTGTVAKTPLATVSIPAGAMGLNGWLEYTFVYSCTNNANTKTFSVEFGGTQVLSRAQSAQTGGSGLSAIANRGVANSQHVAPTSIAPYGDSVTQTTIAIDTSQAQNLIFYATLTNVGDTMTLERYSVRLMNP